jgi:hypothetical protein
VQVIVDDLLARRSVHQDAELIIGLQVIGSFDDGLVGFEEHVLVEMREAVEFRRLGVRTVFDGQFQRDERDGMVFEDDHFKTVGEHAADKLRLRARGCDRGLRRGGGRRGAGGRTASRGLRRARVGVWRQLERRRDERQQDRNGREITRQESLLHKLFVYMKVRRIPCALA